MGAAAAVETSAAVVLRQYVGAFVDELARCGVTDVCICPGSRSTPLAMVLRQHQGLRVWMHLDERSAAFFALGLSMALRRPAALLGTSGTAVVNFAPAVVEARYGGVPLLVLTADRPPELRGVGATQTIDQTRLYGPHAKWSEEMLLPEATPAALRYARTMADRAISTAMDVPAGPVHLNFPFREPLIPAPPAPAVQSGGADRPPQVRVTPARWRPSAADLGGLAAVLRETPRGLMVCGPQDDAAFASAAVRLAGKLAYPLLADVLSQVRCGPHADGCVLDSFDAFLRDEGTAAALRPDLVLRFGATPVSKPLSQFLERHLTARQVVISDGAWMDPQLSASDIFYADATSFCEALTDLLAPAGRRAGAASEEWLALWSERDAAARERLSAALDAEPAMSEPLVFHRLAGLVPEDAIVFAGNSMPVRDLDSFFPRRRGALRFLANRGASGIDGVVSTALGVAAATGQPLVLAIGDISLYHDMNGLLAARRYGDRLNATIVVINNDGGGIFSFLPQAEQAEHYEELFGTPHGLDLRRAADLYGLPYALAKAPGDFDAAVKASLAGRGVSIVEVRTERDANLSLHSYLWERVGQALRRGKA